MTCHVRAIVLINRRRPGFERSWLWRYGYILTILLHVRGAITCKLSNRTWISGGICFRIRWFATEGKRIERADPSANEEGPVDLEQDGVRYVVLRHVPGRLACLSRLF